MIDRLLDTIAPHSCYGCGEVGSVLCSHCMNDIKEEPFLRCIFCLRLTSKTALCTLCAERHDLDAAWCLGERSGVLKAAMNGFKFERVKAAADVFAIALHETTPLLAPDTTVTSVPTVPAHIRERGYDHAALIARRFAKLRGLPYRDLIYRNDSRTQHHATRRERFSYAKDAFQVTHASGRVFVIDDILTTGATIQAVSRALIAAGATSVYAGIIARQPLDEIADL